MLSSWTPGRIKSFITSVLRAGYRKWPPRYEALAKAKCGRKINKASGRMAEHYKCAGCKKEFPAKDVQVDHIQPAVDPIEGFVDWNTFIDRLFCDETNLQVLCTSCHVDIKTKEEREISKISKGIRALYPLEEASYRNMMSRCNNPNATGYEHYGGRGINVCASWKESFYNFYKDMGPRPPDKTLDRMDVNGDYTPENCRWASPIEQGRNTTVNNYIDYEGEVFCVEEWAEKVKIKANTLLYRLRRGWPVGEALGFLPRGKKAYNGRLSIEDIEELIAAIDSGVSQVKYGKEIGMDASQVNRIYHKFKKETSVRTTTRKVKNDN